MEQIKVYYKSVWREVWQGLLVTNTTVKTNNLLEIEGFIRVVPAHSYDNTTESPLDAYEYTEDTQSILIPIHCVHQIND